MTRQYEYVGKPTQMEIALGVAELKFVGRLAISAMQDPQEPKPAHASAQPRPYNSRTKKTEKSR